MGKINFKINDVFSFRWNEKELKNRCSPNHCFDGTLVVKKYGESEVRLFDTYWFTGDNVSFKTDEVESKGTINFLCNLDEMEDIKEWECIYYDDEDVIILSIHAGYRNRYLIKEGTLRSQTKMIKSIQSMIEHEESKIRCAQYSLEMHKKTLKVVEDGDTSVYI